MNHPEQPQHVRRSGADANPSTGAVLATGVEAAAATTGAVSRGRLTGEPVVAHVRDARTGEIDVFVGERKVRIRDRAVAARLASVVD